MFYLNNKVLRRLLNQIALSNIYNQLKGGENKREKDTNSAKLEVELVLR